MSTLNKNDFFFLYLQGMLKCSLNALVKFSCKTWCIVVDNTSTVLLRDSFHLIIYHKTFSLDIHFTIRYCRRTIRVVWDVTFSILYLYIKTCYHRVSSTLIRTRRASVTAFCVSTSVTWRQTRKCHRGHFKTSQSSVSLYTLWCSAVWQWRVEVDNKTRGPFLEAGSRNSVKNHSSGFWKPERSKSDFLVSQKQITISFWKPELSQVWVAFVLTTYQGSLSEPQFDNLTDRNVVHFRKGNRTYRTFWMKVDQDFFSSGFMYQGIVCLFQSHHQY